MTGIDFPTVTIGERTYTVRFSMASQVLMRRRGIDPRRIFHLLSARTHRNDTLCIGKDCKRIDHVPNPAAEQNVLIVFSCCVAEDFVDISKPSTVNLDSAPTADYWAMVLDPDQFKLVEKAIWEAAGKVLEANRKLQAVAPPDKSLAS